MNGLQRSSEAFFNGAFCWWYRFGSRIVLLLEGGPDSFGHVIRVRLNVESQGGCDGSVSHELLQDMRFHPVCPAKTE